MTVLRPSFLLALPFGVWAQGDSCPELDPFRVQLVFAHPFFTSHWKDYMPKLKPVYPQVFDDLKAWHPNIEMGIVSHGNKEDPSKYCLNDKELNQCCMRTYGPVVSTVEEFSDLVNKWKYSVGQFAVPSGSDVLEVIAGLDADNINNHVFTEPPETEDVIRQVIIITNEHPLYGPADGPIPQPNITTDFHCHTTSGYNPAKTLREQFDSLHLHIALMTGSERVNGAVANWTTALEELGYTPDDSTFEFGLDFLDPEQFRDRLVALAREQLCKVAKAKTDCECPSDKPCCHRQPEVRIQLRRQPKELDIHFNMDMDA